MLEESNKSLIGYMRDRATSPLLGAFMISWMGWNYKFILVILAYIPLKDKFELIEEVLYPSSVPTFIQKESTG